MRGHAKTCLIIASVPFFSFFSFFPIFLSAIIYCSLYDLFYYFYIFSSVRPRQDLSQFIAPFMIHFLFFIFLFFQVCGHGKTWSQHCLCTVFYPPPYFSMTQVKKYFFPIIFVLVCAWLHFLSAAVFLDGHHFFFLDGLHFFHFFFQGFIFYPPPYFSMTEVKNLLGICIAIVGMILYGHIKVRVCVCVCVCLSVCLSVSVSVSLSLSLSLSLCTL